MFRIPPTPRTIVATAIAIAVGVVTIGEALSLQSRKIENVDTVCNGLWGCSGTPPMYEVFLIFGLLLALVFLAGRFGPAGQAEQE